MCIRDRLYEEMKKFGRRNIAMLTIAPTGSTSLMTQTSSGIEPVLMPVYKRRRKVNPNDKNVKVDYTDETGDTFEEYTVYHHNFLTWMKTNGYDPEKNYTHEELQELVAKSPYHKACLLYTSSQRDHHRAYDSDDALRLRTRSRAYAHHRT